MTQDHCRLLADAVRDLMIAARSLDAMLRSASANEGRPYIESAYIDGLIIDRMRAVRSEHARLDALRP